MTFAATTAPRITTWLPTRPTNATTSRIVPGSASHAGRCPRTPAMRDANPSPDRRADPDQDAADEGREDDHGRALPPGQMRHSDQVARLVLPGRPREHPGDSDHQRQRDRQDRPRAPRAYARHSVDGPRGGRFARPSIRSRSRSPGTHRSSRPGRSNPGERASASARRTRRRARLRGRWGWRSGQPTPRSSRRSLPSRRSVPVATGRSTRYITASGAAEGAMRRCAPCEARGSRRGAGTRTRSGTHHPAVAARRGSARPAPRHRRPAPARHGGRR